MYSLKKIALYSYGKSVSGFVRHALSLSLLGVCGLLLSSCTATYDKAPGSGTFEGEPRMVAIAPNTFFFYQPKGKDTLFSYTTAKAQTGQDIAKKRGRGAYRYQGMKITPEPMITTGASIPRILWWYPGFSNFDFTRAAIIHDWLFEAHHRWEMAKENGNELQMKHYAAYKDITQEDAADIFAECIKATMLTSDSLRKDLAGVQKIKPKLNDRLEDLRTESKNTGTSKGRLHAYHYFVSPDCVVKRSVKIWNTHHADLGLYELFSEYATQAVERGYLSPWLVGRFKEVEQFKQAQLHALKVARESDEKAEKSGNLRARIYLEVPDKASEKALRSRTREYASSGFDVKTAAVGQSVGDHDLQILYYRESDAQQAEELLKLIQSQTPESVKTSSASTKLIQGENFARPKHFDVRVGSALATSLQK